MRVAYVQYTNPGGYPPLEHSSRILAGRGWKVLFLGTGAVGTAALELPSHPSITVRRLTHCPAGFRQKLHYLWFCIWVVGAVLRWRPRWVYASDPFSSPVTVLLSYLPGIHVIYHEHDSPAEGNRTGFFSFVLRCRRALARRARLCVLPNEQRAAGFRWQTGAGDNVLTVWNCPLREESAKPQKESTNAIWLYYHGSIAAELLPMAVIEALAGLPETVKLRIVGYETIGSRGYSSRIKERAQELGVAHRIQFHEALPRRELLEICRKSDIGLALMPIGSSDPNLRSLAGASNKAFDYLACGLALVVPDAPDWRSMFADPGYGVACDPADRASVAEALRTLIADPERMRAMGECGRIKIQREWNYERQFEAVLAVMEADAA